MFTLASRLPTSPRVGKMLLCAILLVFIIIVFRLNRNLPADSSIKVESGSNATQSLQIDVFYESLCPDSRYFVVNQLYPAWKKLAPIMRLNLWPYGKASSRKVGDSYEFDCQHGSTECEGNFYHACGVNKIENKDKSLEYVKCMIADNANPSGIAKSCAEKISVNFSHIQSCAVGAEGKTLHYVAGKRTEALRPRVSFIPTIEIELSQRSQKLLLKNFTKEVCHAFREKYGRDHELCAAYVS